MWGMNTKQRDADLIRELGGPSKVAELIGIEKHGGAQRVQNWLVRGIPSKVKVDFPFLFRLNQAQAHTQHAPVATESVVL